MAFAKVTFGGRIGTMRDVEHPFLCGLLAVIREYEAEAARRFEASGKPYHEGRRTAYAQCCMEIRSRMAAPAAGDAHARLRWFLDAAAEEGLVLGGVDAQNLFLDLYRAPNLAQLVNQPGTNTGHGHVWARPDGLKARCGGPGICAECRRDQAAQQRQEG